MSELQISTDKTRLDVALIHRFLGEQSTWALGIPRATVERSIANSLCFGGYLDGAQVAFARVVTDCATYAYLVDVFVLPAQRGCGHSKALMTAVMAHPDLQGLRRFALATSTASGLYAQFGFAAPERPQVMMEIYRADVYPR